MDSETIPEIKIEKTETRVVKGSPSCVCWMQEPGFRRVEDVIGFSSQPGSDLQPGQYRLVNSARQFFIVMANENLDFFLNKYANHNF